MKRLESLLWDEWTEGEPAFGSGYHSEEVSGIISGMARTFRKEEVVCSNGRLHVFKRLRKIWNTSEWSLKTPFSSALFIPKNYHGKIHLKLPVDVYAAMAERAASCETRPKGWIWLRGFFGACASLYLPRTGYYLVFRTTKDHQQEALEKSAALLRRGDIPFRTRQRHGLRELTVRDQGGIVNVLTGIRLFRTSLELEEKALLRSVRDRANRLVNCDAANIRKTLEAARRQRTIALRLAETGKLEKLPPEYRDLAKARIDNPTATLTELGQLLQKPVSKSTIEYRWRKMEQMAEESYQGEGG
ncbi:MAG: DNA-binding protein WhiA [Thermovirgaceae bacterium]